MPHISSPILNREQLSAARWDDLMSQYSADPYLYSWHLDVVCPSWKAMVFGDYRAGIPLFERNTLLGKSITHPTFVESIYAVGDADSSAEVESNWQRYQAQFPHVFSLVNSSPENSNRKFQRWTKNEVKGYPGKVLRRNLRKADAAGFTQIYDMEPKEFISLLKFHLKDKNAGYKDKHYDLLESVIAASFKHNAGFIKGIKTERGWHCAQFYLLVKSQCYLVTCFSDSYSRENSGLHFLLHSFFEQLPSNGTVHFGGSNVPAIAEFNKNFGAEDFFYQLTERSYLPGPFKKLLSWL